MNNTQMNLRLLQETAVTNGLKEDGRGTIKVGGQAKYAFALDIVAVAIKAIIDDSVGPIIIIELPNKRILAVYGYTLATVETPDPKVNGYVPPDFIREQWVYA